MISTVALGLFVLLAIVVTYPTATRLSEFSVLRVFTDDLLESWTIEWNVHSLLSGPAEVRQIWEANIFYPYPLTLAFTEHLLPTSALLLPFALLGSTPLVITNLGVLMTTALSGWGMYLLVTWLTGNRWAGLVAGLFFAIAPFRMSHITQLHLISTQWLPFIFLAGARLIKFNRTSDLLLLLLFTNLQFGSVINYAPLVALGLGIWLVGWLFVYRKQVSLSLLARFLIFGGVTFAFNWPILRLYQQVSERMELVRTLGDASIYGASLINYILPIGNSLLYGRLLHLPTHLDYHFPGIGIFVSNFPGVVVLLLALGGVMLLFRAQTGKSLIFITLTTLAITLTGLILSFGANEAALGDGLSKIIGPLLPYPYLYKTLPLLQGLRVPLRFALLTTFGLAILAGIGFVLVGRRYRARNRWFAALVSVLILAEHLPAPLPGVAVPYGDEVYTWLAQAPRGSVVLELPYYLHTRRSNQELMREYQSPIHWQRLVSGASGFKPAWLVKLGQVLDGFPDWRSFEVLRQLEVDYVVLHHSHYQPQDWNNLLGLLPGYLSSIESIHTVGEDLILQLRSSRCKPAAALVSVNAADFPQLSIHNSNPSTYVADPHRVSTLISGSDERQFLEPLFVLPGQTLAVDLPLSDQPPDSAWRVDLANLGVSLSAANPTSEPSAPELAPTGERRPLDIPFANGASLQAMVLGDSPVTCGLFSFKLEWIVPNGGGEVVQVKMIDRFGRLVTEADSRLVLEAGSHFSIHRLPLAETIPAGSYHLQIRLTTAEEAEISSADPSTAPAVGPIVIRAGMEQSEQAQAPPVVARLSNGVGWLASEGLPDSARPGDWLRFTLKWQNLTSSSLADYTVFTQLIGPEGKVWGQHDNPPRGGWYPTSLWSAGEIVADDYAVRLDPAAPPGKYRLIVGMYDPATGERATIEAGLGAGNDFVEVALIAVSGSEK